MHLKSDDIIRLELDYSTGDIPPPFNHVYKLKLSFEKTFVNAQFEIQYLHREELSEADIINEGFTPDDDFRFVGEIPKVWESPLKKLYAQTKWSNQKLLGEEGGVKVLAKDIHGKLVRSIPNNQTEWQYLAQEFIQAIYEVSKREAPLTIRYKSISPEKVWMYEMTIRFATRKIDLRLNGASVHMDWEDAKELLSNIFLPDYDYEIAKASEPTKKGTYIDVGDGLWHDFSQGIYNLDESFDAKSQIKNTFEKLNQLS
ncbi:hypothetical protein ADIS_3219 [Lunatimonas lonarensis]|uniref:Uncharacterized protein n=1 Tax=Lunatimonas lonarensis TaxID=1232681 RepID=R7ZPQ8_9BACT|nr:hypothetical protein [Lunatimonas lonarensis]EON76091.1 hypothetical protein ADIS_3219 [Lunatimonas lonarensis]